MSEERKDRRRDAADGSAAARRADRLAAAMRANLKRRKDQRRARDVAAEPQRGGAEQVEDG